jgi:2-oxoglutarate ferredoxin oxidoreductase subunit delta
MRASPVQLDLALCKACGICIELCPEHVFDRDKHGEPLVARPEDCSQCLICELHCPDFAIEVRRRERRHKAATGAAAGADEVPPIAREDLVSASHGTSAETCAHDGEEG